MRIPVFARGSNPAVDRPILRKSESYCNLQVEEGRADWLDPDDHAKGMICRELIYFGEREIPLEPGDVSRLESAELPGVRFVYSRDRNPAIAAVRVEPFLAAARQWDWTAQSA